MIRRWLFRVGLFFRCRIGERRQRVASSFDFEQSGIRGKIAAKAARIGQLRHEANIRQGWRVTKAKCSSFRAGDHTLFEGGQTEINPMPCPHDSDHRPIALDCSLNKRAP